MIKHINTLSTWLRLRVNSLRLNRCILCHDDADLKGLCSSCLEDLPKPPEGCPLCAEPDWTLADQPCTRCLDAGEVLTATLPLFTYTFPVDQLVVGAKFHGRPQGICSLAAAGLERVDANHPALSPEGVLIPVPLHAHRFAERGYNQAALIAETLSREGLAPMRTDLVTRVRSTRAQSRLGAQARAHNLRNAFRVNGTPPRQAILVDDVMTTGSTLYSLAAALRSAGCERVTALVLARASF